MNVDFSGPRADNLTRLLCQCLVENDHLEFNAEAERQGGAEKVLSLRRPVSPPLR